MIWDFILQFLPHFIIGGSIGWLIAKIKKLKDEVNFLRYKINMSEESIKIMHRYFDFISALMEKK